MNVEMRLGRGKGMEGIGMERKWGSIDRDENERKEIMERCVEKIDNYGASKVGIELRNTGMNLVDVKRNFRSEEHTSKMQNTSPFLTFHPGCIIASLITIDISDPE